MHACVCVCVRVCVYCSSEGFCAFSEFAKLDLPILTFVNICLFVCLFVLQKGVYDEPMSGFFRNVDTRCISLIN